VRGPQALFYGKNSPAGVVSITSNDPGDEPEMIIGANYEYEAKEKRGHLVLSGPISERFGARLVASYSEQDGLIKVIGYDAPLDATTPLALAPTKSNYDARKDVFVRGTLLFEPTDQLRIRAKFSYFDREGGSITWSAQRTFCPLGAPQATIAVDDCKIDDTAYFGQIHPSILYGFTQADPSRPDGTLENRRRSARSISITASPMA
jgi:outer membrane receptor protein involved in Fe transport